MKRKFTSAALAVAMLAALHPANAQPRITDKPKSQLHILSVAGFETIPYTDCSGVYGQPVTVRVGALLAELANNGKVGRNITRKLANGTDQPVDPPANTGYNWPTNLDMELAETATGGGYVPNDYVMVTVVLRVLRGINFLRPMGVAVTDSTLAVTVDPNTKNRFCGRTEVTTTTTGGKTFQYVSFGMLKDTVVRSINIGIMIPDNVANPTYWLPIIIDPNVRNTG